MLGPVLIAFGSDEQKAKYLPRILSGEDWRARIIPSRARVPISPVCAVRLRDGDHYVRLRFYVDYVAQYADWIFCLVCTNTKVKQEEGISFLLIDSEIAGRYGEADHRAGRCA